MMAEIEFDPEKVERCRRDGQLYMSEEDYIHLLILYRAQAKELKAVIVARDTAVSQLEWWAKNAEGKL